MPKSDAGGRPHCSQCDVDMWLTRVGGGPDGGHSYVFECKVCGERTLVSATQNDAARIEDGL